MRWSVGSAAILLLAGVVTARGEDRVRIATFNCEFLSRAGVHVKYGLPLYERDWTARQRAYWEQLGPREELFQRACGEVAKVIARIDADVLALQEVGPDEDLAVLYDAVRKLGLEYPHREVGSGIDRDAYVQYVAVWSRRPLRDVMRTIPGRALYDVEFDDPDEERETGVDKGLHAVFDAGGKPIHFYCLHLKSERGGHESDAKRLAQATLVRRHCLRFLNRPAGGGEAGAETAIGGFVIIAGDLNDGPGQPTLRRIRGKDDVFGDFIQTWQTAYFHERAKWPERWSREYHGSRERIDHILVSLSLRPHLRSQQGDFRGITAETLAIDETLEAFGGVRKPASDHRPFIVTLRFR